MIKPSQHTCKKCSAVVTVDFQVWPDHLDVKVKDGTVHDEAGKVVVRCKKCKSAVAQFAVGPFERETA
jgi:hypothetical protein